MIMSCNHVVASHVVPSISMLRCPAASRSLFPNHFTWIEHIYTFHKFDKPFVDQSEYCILEIRLLDISAMSQYFSSVSHRKRTDVIMSWGVFRFSPQILLEMFYTTRFGINFLI